MRATPLQTSFVGGELSKRLRARIDTDLYKVGVEYAENFMVLPQGPLRMRGGTDHLLDLAAEPRFIQFRMTDQQDYVIELHDQAMQLYSVVGGQLVSEFVLETNLLQNGNFLLPYGAGWDLYQATPAVWKTPAERDTYLENYPFYDDGSADPSYGGFAHGPADFVSFGTGYGAKALRQKVTLDAPATLKLSYKVLRYINKPGGGTSNTRVDISTVANNPGVNGDVLHLSHAQGAAGEIVTVDNIGPLAAGDYWVMVGTDYGGGAGPHVDDIKLTATAVGPAEPFPVETPWTADELAEVQYAIETGVNRMIFFHPGKGFYVLKYNGPGSWDFGVPLLAGAPQEWIDGNWPATGALHQGRLWVSGMPSEKNRVFASRSGALFDFTTKSTVGGTETVLPSDGIDRKAATQGAIMWMRAHRQLLIGTDIGEVSVSSQGAVITPADIKFRDESAFGSAPVQALSVGTHAIFVSGDRRKIRAIKYDQDGEGWDSKDVTFTAEHITDSDIEEIHHVRAPESYILAKLANGKMVACTFDPTENVSGWWRLTVGDAVKSASVSHGPAGTFLWLAVQRGANLALERLALSENAVQGYLDSAEPAVLGGLGVMHVDHFADGAQVRVVSGGADLGTHVVQGGAVLFDVPEGFIGQPAMVGLAFRAKAVTLPPADYLLGKMRFAKAGLLLNDSALPLVNGKRAAPDRTPATPQDAAEPLTTGKVRMATLGWTEDGKLTIEQDLPFRTEILGVFGIAAANSLG